MTTEAKSVCGGGFAAGFVFVAAVASRVSGVLSMDLIAGWSLCQQG